MQELLTLQNVSVLNDSHTCLFNTINSLCQYDPKNPQIYFSLGEAVAAIGIIFAVIQLYKPTWYLTLRIKGRFTRNLVWIFSLLGASCVLLASILPQTDFYNLPFGYPIFWEIIGFIFFLIAPFSLLVTANSYKNIFSEKNAINFYHTILFKGISNGKQEYLESSVDIINLNLDKLGIYIAESQNETNNEVHLKISCDLINLVLSERKVADYIVTNRLDFIVHLVDVIKKNHLTAKSIGMGFEKIVERLFGNTDSYFYRQLEYEGLTLYAPIYEMIFGDTFILKEFSILSPNSLYFLPDSTKNDERYSKTHLKAMCQAIETNGFNDPQISARIAFALYKIPEYITNLAYDANKIDKINQKPNINAILMEVGNFLGRDFPELYKKAVISKKVDDCEKTADSGKGKYDRSLTASYAEVMVEYIGAITRFNDREMEFHEASLTVVEIMPIHDSDNTMSMIRKRFLEFIWSSIENNVKRGYFPEVLRIYLQLMRWNDKSMPKWREEERKKLVDYINSELSPRLIKKEPMANFKDLKETELLPNDMFFDHKKKKFFIKSRDGSKKEY